MSKTDPLDGRIIPVEQIRQCNLMVRREDSTLRSPGAKSPSSGHILCHPDLRSGLTPVAGGAGSGQPTEESCPAYHHSCPHSSLGSPASNDWRAWWRPGPSRPMWEDSKGHSSFRTPHGVDWGCVVRWWPQEPFQRTPCLLQKYWLLHMNLFWSNPFFFLFSFLFLFCIFVFCIF